MRYFGRSSLCRRRAEAGIAPVTKDSTETDLQSRGAVDMWQRNHLGSSDERALGYTLAYYTCDPSELDSNRVTLLYIYSDY